MSDESIALLAERYCEYIGANMEYSPTDTDDLLIAVWPKDETPYDCFYYRSWDGFFFGDEEPYHIGGLCRSHWFTASAKTGWGRIRQRIIAVSSLEELELQLAARGF